ncbi:MAG TPA: hypothetical protein VFP63_04905 [Dehalococcoidia bacterium]|nr:hypothetical protein [Dehalococcoidia bacterium]
MRLLFTGIVGIAFVVVMSIIGLQFTTHGDNRAPAPTGARLELNGNSFDLGEVPPTEVVERKIDFSNTGVAPLEVSIVKVRPAPDGDCGCGVEGFEVRPESVRPGGAGELVFLLKVPDGMEAMEDKMIAELATNDPDRESLKIVIVFRMGA